MKTIFNYIAVGLSSFFLIGCKEQSNAQQPTLVKEFSLPPKPKGWIADFENLLNSNQINFLDSIISRHEAETSNEIAVVTLQIDSTEVPDMKELKKYSLALFNAWGIGKKNKNNGIGIIISAERRLIRIETGFGLESKLTDKEAKTIIDTIFIPSFKKAEFFEGIKKGLSALMAEIK